MKKKNLALILIAAMSAVTISAVVPSAYNQIFADLNGDPDCAYLESTCTSLAQIIDENYHSTDHANGKSYEKTWGTVSAIYTQSNYYHAFIQSTSSYGTAGICLYRVSPTSMGCPLKVGDFVYASGTMTFYNGMYELEIRNSSGALIDGNSFTVDETMTSYDIETYEIPSEEASATPSNATAWEKINLLGNIRVSLNNLTINTAGTAETKAVTSDGKEVILYYNSVNVKAAAYNKLDTIAHSTKHANITGYLTAFTNSSKSVAEILIRYDDDIEECKTADDDNVDVTNITINGDYSSYGYGDKFYLNYSVYPENATNKEVTFDSTNYNVADVDTYGFVEIIGFGTATIRASSVSNPDVYDEIEIVVATSSDTITSIDITLDPDKVYVDSEDGFERNWVDIPVDVATHVGQISLSPSTASANQLGVDVFSYEIYDSCNDISVQITDELDLILTASKSGQYEIVVYDVDQYWIYDYFEVNVVAGYATDFSIDPTSYTLDIDDTFSITPTAIPAGNILPTVKYQSMDEDVATVSSTGVVTAVGKGTTDIRVSIDNFETYKTCTVTVTEPEYKYTIDFSSMSTGSYSTNFGRKTIGGIEYGYYRAKSYSGYWRLYPSANLTSATTYSLPGAFYNDDPTYAITSLEITYEGVGVVKYGNHKNSLSSTALSSSSSKTTVTVDANSSFYWYVEATTGTLDIYSIVAKYDHSKPVTGMYTPADRQDVRIPATTYSGALVDGVSYVNVPNDITISGTNYTVNSYKKLTYYSFDYVQEHSDSLDLDAIALTDPSDVAAYYIAFGCAPANYYAINSVSAVDSDLGSDSEVYSLFGEDARCVSQYNRTDGYAVGIPYNGSKPVYLEFDFASNSSYSANPSSKSRDVSRVVIWTGGWKGYETAPVATMTDDHYVTFREFNNAYGWNDPFDSIENGNYTSSRTGYKYGSTTTLTAK